MTQAKTPICCAGAGAAEHFSGKFDAAVATRVALAVQQPPMPMSVPARMPVTVNASWWLPGRNSVV